MKANKSIIVLLLLFCAAVGFSQRPSFLYKRKIADISQEGWYRIAIPANMFTHLERSFNDIRIYSITATDTIEIPYLLKVLEDVISENIVELPISNKSKKNDVLFFSVATQGNAVNYLDLTFEEQNYNAFVKIEGSNDQLEWFELIDNQRILSINNQSVQYKTSQVHFPFSNYPYLRISVRSDVSLTLLKASFKNLRVKPGVIRKTTASTVVKSDNRNKETVVDIKFSDVTPINQIEISAANDLDYYRSFTLEYASDSSKTQKGWTVFYSLLHHGYLTSFNKNIYSFNFQLAKKLRLTINNLDNPPLTINHIEGSGPEIVLLAKLKPANIYLFYGNKTLQHPSYDLVHFEEKIPDSLSYVTLHDEEIIASLHESRNPLFASKQWLWVVMLLVVATMGFFTFRMMQKR
jgi:hypothetical protein